jgi:hypothetical protein
MNAWTRRSALELMTARLYLPSLRSSASTGDQFTHGSAFGSSVAIT